MNLYGIIQEVSCGGFTMSCGGMVMSCGGFIMSCGVLRMYLKHELKM